MKLSRFVAASSREVMRLVREALGPDALIVSNRSVAEGIEVVATLDETPAAAPATPLVTHPSGPPFPATTLCRSRRLRFGQIGERAQQVVAPAGNV
ncbi:flagellar biosynthesis protein FlhF, partial [Bordetella bronchiseptica]